jgi:ABC-type amino acid transport substrate-binding protein
MLLLPRISVLIAIFLGVGVAAQRTYAQTAEFHLVEPGYLTVGTYGTGIPAIIVGPGDKLGGLDGALLNTFARDHNLQIKLYQTTFASQILAVEQGKIDVGTYVFHTAERAKHVFYTYPFWVSHAVIFTSKSTPYSGPKSMEGKKVGTVVGFVWAPYLQKWSATGGVLFPDQATIAQALLNGQIDGYVNGEVLLHTPPISDSPDIVAHRLEAGDFGFPASILSNLSYNIVNCSNRNLAAAMDQEFAKSHSDGEWQAVLKDNGLTADADVDLKSPDQVCSGG